MSILLAGCFETGSGDSVADVSAEQTLSADSIIGVVTIETPDTEGTVLEEPVEGASVEIEGHPEVSTTTDAGGSFTLSLEVSSTGATRTAMGGASSGSLGQGPFTVVATYEKEGEKFAKRIPGLLMLGGLPLDLGTFKIEETGAIQGVVSLGDGETPLGVDVYIPGTSYIAKADENGAFLILWVPAGDYTLVYQTYGYHYRSIGPIHILSKEIAFVDPVVLTPKSVTPPTVTILSGPDDVVRSQVATFQFEASNGTQEFFCKVGNGQFASCRSPYSIANVGEGTHEFEVAAADASGGPGSNSATWQWTVDLTAPLLVVDSRPNAVTSLDTASFEFSVDDASAVLVCELDEETVECGLQTSFTALAPGFHSLQVKAVDAAGNESATKVLSWQYDLTIVNTLLVQSPPALSNQTIATIAFTANKSATFACSFDAQAWQTCTSPQTYSGITEGAHTLSVRATDLGGLTDDSPLEVGWTIDSTVPGVPSPVIPAGGLTKDATPVLSWNDSTTDVNYYELQVDVLASFNSTLLRAFTGIAIKSQRVLPLLTDGRWYFRVRGVDLAGNASAWSAAHDFTVDTQPPEVPVTQYIPNPTNDARPFFSWLPAADAVSYRVMVATNGAFEAPLKNLEGIGSTSYQPPDALPEGVVFWKVAAVDAAGNQSQFSLTKNFTIDTAGPGVPTINLIVTPSKVTTQTFSWSVVAGAAKYRIQISADPNFQSFTVNDGLLVATSYTSAALVDNIYYWRVAAVDAAQNTGGFSQAQQFVIDTVVPPAPLLNAYTPNPTNNLTPTLTWSSPGAGAVSYDILIKQGTTILINETGLTSLSYRPNPALPPVAVLTWQVRARDAAGNIGSYSTASSLTTTSAASWTVKFFRDFQLFTAGENKYLNFVGSAPVISGVRYTSSNYSLTHSAFRNNSWLKSSLGAATYGTSSIPSQHAYTTDAEGNLWLAASKGLWRYQVSSNSWSLISNTALGTGYTGPRYAVVSPDAVYVSYYYSNSTGMTVRRFDRASSTWGSEELLAPASFESSGGCLAMNGSRLGILFYQSVNSTSYWLERSSDGVWTSQGVDPNYNVSSCSERFTYSGGFPVIKNVSNGVDKTWNGSSFVSTTSTAKRYSLALNTANNYSDVYLSYFNGLSPVRFDITRGLGVNLYQTTYGNVIDNNFGNPIATFYSVNDSKVAFAASASITSVDMSPNLGQYSATAFTSNGNPRIAYYDGANGKLKLVEKVDGSWTVSIIDTVDVGKFASIGLKSTGKGVVSYYDANNRDLKVATEGVGWSTYTVDSAGDGDTGQHTSLVIGSDDNPSVAYYDATLKRLRLAQFNGSVWTIETVDEASDVGKFASLALDASNNPSIAYYDADGQRLKYAVKNGSHWDISVVDSAADVGQHASLALKSTGSPMIAYYDATSGAVKFAEYSGSTWSSPSTLATASLGSADSGRNLSLTRDAQDRPHVVYYDATSKDLRYGNRDVNWAFRTIDGDDSSTQDRGRNPSLRINPVNGAPSASYFDALDGGVHFVEGMVLY